MDLSDRLKCKKMHPRYGWQTDWERVGGLVAVLVWLACSLLLWYGYANYEFRTTNEQLTWLTFGGPFWVVVSGVLLWHGLQYWLED